MPKNNICYILWTMTPGLFFDNNRYFLFVLEWKAAAGDVNNISDSFLSKKSSPTSCVLVDVDSVYSQCLTT